MTSAFLRDIERRKKVEIKHGVDGVRAECRKIEREKKRYHILINPTKRSPPKGLLLQTYSQVSQQAYRSFSTMKNKKWTV
ncbi:hypothetical protein V1477_010074 [Vespula maculifrons]|uniref:Uncharacterized protein n=1 Tax=Vespula maculifrons TaxID=7453 RepID=A0ABD2CBK7_VESMC